MITLSSAALLLNENGSSRITSTGGGYVTITADLNAPIGANPGNLGAIITTSKDMGATVIKRGHQSQQSAGGQGSSIYRYYDITPTNNTALNAMLRFQYFDEELNGLAENTLVVFKSQDNVHWANMGYSGRNTTSNFVDRDAIADFSRWTLSSANNALPLIFSVFNVQCKNNTAFVQWTTAQEQNTLRFDIESSTDGVHWQVIGTVPAAGNSTVEQKYTFTDHNPAPDTYYRIAEHDASNTVYYTGIVRNDCGAKDSYRVWPNPFTQTVFINVAVAQTTPFVLKIYDNKGVLISTQNKTLQPGSNQLQVNLGNKANGVYYVVAEWGSDTKKVATVIKAK
jgi:hypothetical protein